MPIPQTKTSGTSRDKDNKSFVESPTRGSDYTAQEVYLGNSESNPDLNSDFKYDSFYNAISGVATGVSSPIISKVISTEFFLLENIEVGGDNKAEYEIIINGSQAAKKRTYYTRLNEHFFFGALKLLTGETISVNVIHSRPYVGNFEARIIGISKL